MTIVLRRAAGLNYIEFLSAGRCSAGFLGVSHFHRLFHSGAAPYSPHFSLVGSQDLDRRNDFQVKRECKSLRERHVVLCIKRVVIDSLTADVVPSGQFPRQSFLWSDRRGPSQDVAGNSGKARRTAGGDVEDPRPISSLPYIYVRRCPPFPVRQLPTSLNTRRWSPLWLASPGTKGHFRIFACEIRAGRCRWSACFLGDLPFHPPLHSGAAPYLRQSPSSILKTSMLKAAQISPLRPTTAKLDKQLGESGGPHKKLDEIDQRIIQILGKDSPVIKGFGVIDSMGLRRHKDCREVVVNLNASITDKPAGEAGVEHVQHDVENLPGTINCSTDKWHACKFTEVIDYSPYIIRPTSKLFYQCFHSIHNFVNYSTDSCVSRVRNTATVAVGNIATVAVGNMFSTKRHVGVPWDRASPPLTLLFYDHRSTGEKIHAPRVSDILATLFDEGVCLLPDGELVYGDNEQRVTLPYLHGVAKHGTCPSRPAAHASTRIIAIVTHRALPG
ncbi:hypothetical protein PR048_000324 [Dryococelus australis]|uniref:Uncharacterized protein n=1 Tax=Dryococelus australis TaxID=614101 RepID=A0ABQ9IFM4_9NEOP|nr:hypothetical protein PR048_000324 [Dryococelus australis]